MPHSLVRQQERLWRRQPSLHGQISLDDATERQIVLFGDMTSDASVRVAGCHLDVTLNGQGNIDAWVEVAINGSMVQIGDVIGLTSDGGIELVEFGVGSVLNNQHIGVYCQGNQSSPGTPGTVDYQIEYSSAGPDSL